MALRLTKGDWDLGLLPETGGAVAWLRHQGHDILRAAPVGTANPLETGNFVLVPFANRVAGGRFRFAGIDRQLWLNHGDHPHALHGTGWQSAWTVAAASPDHVRLVHEMAAGPRWPFDIRAEQLLALTPEGFRHELRLENRSTEAMPASIGFHPYFPRAAETLLKADLGAPWRIDGDSLATEKGVKGELGDWSAGAPPMGAGLIDHCFDGWGQRFEVIQGNRRAVVTASGNLPKLHLYMPPGETYFCAEPVSHMPDSFNRGEEARPFILQPGESVSAWMEITAS